MSFVEEGIIQDKEEIFWESIQEKIMPEVFFNLVTLDFLPTPYRKKFKIEGSMVEKIGSNGWTQLLLNKEIQKNEILRIKWKIIKSEGNYISIGVVDKKQQINEEKSFSSGNAAVYSGYWK